MTVSVFQAAGGSVDPTRAAPLTQGHYLTGLWTNRSPLRDAATPWNYQNYGVSRFDSLLDGRNAELSARLTYVRAPGSTVYNTQDFDEILNFFEFDTNVDGTADNRILVDDGAVWDASGPNTKLNIWNKSPGAGQTYYITVGNTIYFGNGVDTKQWIVPSLTWKPGKTYDEYKFVLDDANNLQMSIGSFTVEIVSIAITGNTLTVILDPNSDTLPFDLNLMAGIHLTFAGLTAAPFLNGQTVTLRATNPAGLGSTSFMATFAHADYATTPDSGTVTSGNGVTAGVAPGWNHTLGGITFDAGAQWINKGNWVRNWGIVAPTKSPTMSQTPATSITPAWASKTYYSTCYLITDPDDFIQKVTLFGATGTVLPVFSHAVGGITGDGSVQWTCQGSGAYAPATLYNAGAYIFATIGATRYFFQAETTGNASGTVTPAFSSILGSSVNDNGILWVNVGIGQTWQDVTSSSMLDGFAIIGVQGGGTIAIGAGVNAGNGTFIALPTGYSTANMAGWNSPCIGFGAQSSGVFQATSLGGVLNASFQSRANSFDVAASSNWAAAAWSADAIPNIVISAIGGLTYVSFTTTQGDQLVICAGPLANGASISVPGGGAFSAAQFANIVGLAGTAATGNGMNIAQSCFLNGTLQLTTLYNDNSGNTWAGTGNVFGIFWEAGGGVTTIAVTGGNAIMVPTSTTESVCFAWGNTGDATTFGLPAGFGSIPSSATCAMAGGTLNGSHVAHGWNATLSGATAVSQYTDGTGIYTIGTVNFFAVAALLAPTPISPNQIVDDQVGDLQSVLQSGLSGSTAPAWSDQLGGITLDNSIVWGNVGIDLQAATGPQTFAYAYRAIIDGSESTSSPISATMQRNANNNVFGMGNYSTDFQVDVVVIYRTAQNGSILLELDQIPNNPAGGTWQYEDVKGDAQLNAEIEAAINHANDPPPSNFVPYAYHLQRIFGACGNVLTYSGGPATTTGNGNTAFPPKNNFPFPSTITWAWSTSIGLIAFTLNGYKIVLGQGTPSSPLYAPNFQDKIGLPTSNVFTVNGSTAYCMTTAGRVISMDPGAGELEIGFPIGDQFDSTFVAQNSYFAFHEGSSEDVALYCGDGSTGWFRYSILSAPETGGVWSPRRQIVGGIRAIASVQLTPQNKQVLLMGPKGGGQILMRDSSTYQDKGTPYPMWIVAGNITVAAPGWVATVGFVTLDSELIGKAPVPSLMLGEIPTRPNAPKWTKLARTSFDPALLGKAATLFNDRHAYAQQQKSQDCRHLALRIDWAAENAANELLQHTIWGEVRKEMVGGS